MRRKMLVACIATLALMLLWHVRPRMLRPAYLVVRNASGSELSNLEIIVQHHRGEGAVLQSMPRLANGEELFVRHGLTDSALILRFVLRGDPRQHEVSYIDLWTGEGWRVEIGRDGTARSGHDYPGHVLQEQGPPNPALQPPPPRWRG